MSDVGQFFSEMKQDPATRGLTFAQIRFLVTLFSCPAPPTITQLAVAAAMKRQQAWEIAEALTDLGLVEKKPTDDNLRIKLVELTEHGRAACEKLAALYRKR